MDPFTIALATFGIQKLRGKSTKRSLRDAAIAGGLGQFAGMAGLGQGTLGRFAPQAFGSIGNTVGTAGMTIPQQMAATPIGGGLERLIGKPGMTADQVKTAGLEGEAAKKAMEGYGYRSFSPGAQLGLGLGASTLLAGQDETELPEGTRPEDYKEAKERADKQLEGIIEGYDYSNYGGGDASPYDYTNQGLYTFSKGGIAEIRKFNSKVV
jgi:hypothetical protein